ncbi:MAG: type I methionyl aminopeptidase [bacterium]|jgi:methionyl aminopeptidase|nr:type I methionyl aminopeptidase [bacterium]
MARLYSSREFEGIRRACRILPQAFRLVEAHIGPGVSTAELNRIVDSFIRSQGARPSFIGVPGPPGVAPFPACCCISINDEVVHGIPGDRLLQEGDIVKIDAGTCLDGCYGDSARSFPVGRVSEERRRLMVATRESLFKGIEAARGGNRIGDIGAAVSAHVEALGYSVVRDMVGHGVGGAVHEAPEVPNYGTAGQGLRLRAGMCLALEPMINAGEWRIRVLGDGWTVATADGSDSAHFEHQIRVTDAEPEILTLD